MIVSNSFILYNFIHIIYVFSYVNIIYFVLYSLVKYYNNINEKTINNIFTLFSSLTGKKQIKQDNNLKDDLNSVSEDDNASNSSSSSSSSNKSSSTDNDSSKYRKQCFKKLDDNLGNMSLASSKDYSDETNSTYKQNNDKLKYKANVFKKALEKSYLNYDNENHKYICNLEVLVNIAKNFVDSKSQNKIIYQINNKWYIVGKNLYKQINNNDNLLIYCNEKLKHHNHIRDQIDSKEIYIFKLDLLANNKKNHIIYGITYLQ